jgi:glutathione synthase
MKYNLLVVTDHTTHSSANSLYELSLAMAGDPRSKNVWVCSKGLPGNNDFFSGIEGSKMYVAPVGKEFAFNPDGSFFEDLIIEINPDQVDAILIRMPQPLDKKFLLSLECIAPKGKIINDPEGTIETSSKEYLLQLSHLCPSIKMCYNLQEAIELSHEIEIVLKPLYSYGGRGIVRLSPEYFWVGSVRFEAEEIHKLLPENYFPMLAMQYLPNVSFGDKRTIVVNRQILGSALRMPPADSWICNVAQGGHALISQVDEAEINIEKELTPRLFEKGVIIYGFDTLVDDNGVRVLSEINTLSIGGMGPIEEMSGRPILKQAAKLLWDILQDLLARPARATLLMLRTIYLTAFRLICLSISRLNWISEY